MKKVLITGITGFLGRRLAQKLSCEGYQVVGTSHSEAGLKSFEAQSDLFKEMDIFTFDMADSYHHFMKIFSKYDIDYIVHCAALKHVGICEKNPTRAIDVNVIGSSQLIKAALHHGVKNIIGISTDKSVQPQCVYGMTKKLMEDMLIENDFGVFQGVNFLFSTGSVLDIWERMIAENKKILANRQAIRYFCKIEDVCETIIRSLDAKHTFTVRDCYKINIGDLQYAFCKYHDYWNVGEYKPLNVEKMDEDLPACKINIKVANKDEIFRLLVDYYQSQGF